MSGFKGKYGEIIKNKVLNTSKNYISHYEQFQEIPLNMSIRNSSNSIGWKSHYKGENTTPGYINKTELDKELEYNKGSGRSGGGGSGGGQSGGGGSGGGRSGGGGSGGGQSGGGQSGGGGSGGGRSGGGGSGGGQSGGKKEIVMEEIEAMSPEEPSPKPKKEGGFKKSKIPDLEFKQNKEMVLDEKAKELSNLLKVKAQKKSGALRKYKRKDWNLTFEKIKDPVLKKLIKQHKKGFKYGSGCDICELNQHLTGGGFWDKLKKAYDKTKDGVKKAVEKTKEVAKKVYKTGKKVYDKVSPVVKTVAPIIETVAPMIDPVNGTALSLGMKSVGLGKSGGKKKEKKGKEDPVIEELLGGSLEMKANYGSSFSGGKKKAKKSPGKMNNFMKAKEEARKANKESFEYNGKTYKKAKTKTGMVIYKKA